MWYVCELKGGESLKKGNLTSSFKCSTKAEDNDDDDDDDDSDN